MDESSIPISSDRTTTTVPAHPARVIILGAGFAGVSAVRELTRRNLRDKVAVTLIDHHPYVTFQPLLYQVATGGLNPGDITYPLRTLLARRKRRFRYRRSSVTGVDATAQTITCDDGVVLPYDYLLICNGVTANFFGIPGAEANALPMYTRADALKVRDTLFGGLERIAGEAGADPKARRGFTTLIVGGGATGVEMAGTLAEMRDTALSRSFPELDPTLAKVVMIEMAPQLLTPFKKRLQDYAYRQLVKRRVDIRLNTAISSVRPDGVTLSDGTDLGVDLVVWAAGIGAYGRVADWGLPQGRGGRILVGDDLRVQGQDRVFAAGDTAVNPDASLPQLAQPAIQGGRHVARQILRLLDGQPTEPFHYSDHGTMATIGERAAVVQLPVGPTFTGTIAWGLWIMVHIAYLLGGRNRFLTMINLGLRYLSFRRTGGIIGDIRDTPARKAADDKAY